MIATDIEYGVVVIERRVIGNRIIYEYSLDPPDCRYIKISDVVVEDFCDAFRYDEYIHIGPYHTRIVKEEPFTFICEILDDGSD